MGFYDTKEGVDQYFALADGSDGKEIIEILKGYLPSGSSVLEIGIGPGKDLDLLAENYLTCGSDYSEIFLERYRETHANSDLLQLDAVTLDTSRTFDCIYSNKVLHHLTREDFIKSIARQALILNEGGIVCHTFWKGTDEESHEGLRFVNYVEKDLENLFGNTFDILHLSSYKEMGFDDSILLIAAKSKS